MSPSTDQNQKKNLRLIIILFATSTLIVYYETIIYVGGEVLPVLERMGD